MHGNYWELLTYGKIAMHRNATYNVKKCTRILITQLRLLRQHNSHLSFNYINFPGFWGLLTFEKRDFFKGMKQASACAMKFLITHHGHERSLPSLEIISYATAVGNPLWMEFSPKRKQRECLSCGCDVHIVNFSISLLRRTFMLLNVMKKLHSFGAAHKILFSAA